MGIFRRRLLIRAALSAVPELPDWFRKSLILWYSIPRQKATNGSLAASPLLVDFSGNGMDGTLYNFSFSGLSGIGSSDPEYLFFDGVDDRLRTAAAFDADVGTVLMEMMDMTDGASKFQTFFDVEIIRTYLQRTSRNVLTAGSGNTLGVEGNIYRIDYSSRHLSSKLSVGANVFSKEFSLVGLRQMMMFSRNLTEKEYEWIKLNLMRQDT